MWQKSIWMQRRQVEERNFLEDSMVTTKPGIGELLHRIWTPAIAARDAALVRSVGNRARTSNSDRASTSCLLFGRTRSNSGILAGQISTITQEIASTAPTGTLLTGQREQIV